MKLTGLHILLTFQCTFECDHCFVWGSPWQEGTLTLAQLRDVLRQAGEVPELEWIYFEGGESFLYYPILVQAVREAAGAGYKVGIVTNAYWATAEEDALEWLRPLAGLVQDLSVSSDLFHYSEEMSRQARTAEAAGRKLGLPMGSISIAQPEDEADEKATVLYKGRAAEKLTERADLHPWEGFTECPHEDLREPGRVHLDPLGNLHPCQGIVIGNLFERPLREICEGYDPDAHPVAGPVLKGGPAELVRRYGLPRREEYADACHLCYEARSALRDRFPAALAPDQVYGVTGEE
jgi:MoaA/NifB/PqqE/SkfB family radical SAM enzyme